MHFWWWWYLFIYFIFSNIFMGAAGSDGYRISFRFLFRFSFLFVGLFVFYSFSLSFPLYFVSSLEKFTTTQQKKISHCCWWHSIATSTSIFLRRWSMAFHRPTFNIFSTYVCKISHFRTVPDRFRFSLLATNCWTWRRDIVATIFTEIFRRLLGKMCQFLTLSNGFSFSWFEKMAYRKMKSFSDQFHQKLVNWL